MPQDTITENVDLVKYKARAEGIRTDYTSLEIRVVGALNMDTRAKGTASRSQSSGVRHVMR
jgi:hypothetical protein